MRFFSYTIILFFLIVPNLDAQISSPLITIDSAYGNSASLSIFDWGGTGQDLLPITHGHVGLNLGFDARNTFDFVSDVFFDSEGAAIFVGQNYDKNPIRNCYDSTSLFIGKVTKDGVYDTLFAPFGRITNNLDRLLDTTVNVVKLTDGGFLLAGGTRLICRGKLTATITKVDAYGRMDSTFGAGGRVFLPTLPNADDFVMSILARSDGNYALVGNRVSFYPNGGVESFQFFHALMLPNGSLDTEYADQKGMALASFTPDLCRFNFATHAAIDYQNRLIIVGYQNGFFGSYYFLCNTFGNIGSMLRYLPDGTLDPNCAFNIGNDLAAFPWSDYWRRVISRVFTEPDGKILVAEYGDGSGNGFRRFLENGERDSSFGINSFSLFEGFYFLGAVRDVKLANKRYYVGFNESYSVLPFSLFYGRTGFSVLDYQGKIIEVAQTKIGRFYLVYPSSQYLKAIYVTDSSIILGSSLYPNITCGFAVKFKFPSVKTVSTQDIEPGLNTVVLYPNPTNGTVYFKSLEMNATDIKVYDLKGKLVMAIPQLTRAELDISFLTAGMYFIQMRHGGVISRYRVIRL
jgi:Secretion system C-terminal sorting domain/Domain of unknown function (DUF5122) beta-propeller